MSTITQVEVPAVKARTGQLKLKAEQAKQEFPDINTIRKAIPAHCFKPSTLRSLGYVARDLAMAVALGYAALTYIPSVPNQAYRTLLWTAYGFLQGLVGVGLWILAHECGHGAFSVHRHLNDFVGWVLHSALGVPFFSWKFSHARHHRFTGHMQKDMAFVPRTSPSIFMQSLSNMFSFVDMDVLEDAPFVNLIRLLGQQLGGFQIYFLLNATAGDESMQNLDAKWWRRSHFDPFSGVFRPQEALYVLISDLGLALVCAALYYGSLALDWQMVFLLYGVPYLWVNHWLVAITYLHHTHKDVPHYDGEKWSFVAGALATVDRDFGFIGRHVFHGIIDTHVVHHLFSRIPFYHAEEATRAIKPLLGDLYHCDDHSFMASLWETSRACQYVENDPANPGVMKWHE
ncbi:fatty acid desaturase-domain-containing protein [Annulohypoxylon truncatum]|uniref:fatty acid desaturase-domain-containing protein n=1 Tax=Annulohypoxylon truncatum TaxID=327061 RepID=UPI002007EB21|nr:fatty acid desaturase-domain-containing protein [Annulohypoxylon truncatum]KAI1211466.1 fatty acid desaturase-domain-containing protein [Annulohypoxylon truncatum]